MVGRARLIARWSGHQRWMTFLRTVDPTLEELPVAPDIRSHHEHLLAGVS
jgi:hypothetical protein